MAIFHLEAPCPFCDGKKLEIVMSPSAFNTIKAICMKCKKHFEY